VAEGSSDGSEIDVVDQEVSIELDIRWVDHKDLVELWVVISDSAGNSLVGPQVWDVNLLTPHSDSLIDPVVGERSDLGQCIVTSNLEGTRVDGDGASGSSDDGASQRSDASG